jgi:hypothetical protein
MITFLRDLIFKDFWLKFFSLALAVLIWSIVNIALHNETSPVPSLTLGATEQRKFANVPVLLMSSASDVRSFSVNPREVEVTVQGDAKIVRNLHDRDIRVLVDLTGIEAAHDLRKRIEVSAPTGVSPLRVDPEEVQVIFPTKN